jgi:hypothetical protein
VPLADDLERISDAAEPFADPDERMSGILAAATLGAPRVYLCSFESEAGTTWLALDDDARPVGDAGLVHDAASLAALVEVVEELAGIELLEPRLATNEYLDEIGARLEGGLAAAVEQAFPAAEAVADQVVARHKTPLA